MAYFEVEQEDKGTQARMGRIKAAHGSILTPAFVPIGTKGAVKTVTPQELEQSGADIILANTYHLWQRPGDELIARAGGLHKFMGWGGPIMTDSGGFQVFSLGVKPKVTEEGVWFRSELDGDELMLSPEKSIAIQANLGSDIALILDDFPGYPFEYDKSQLAIKLTQRWAERTRLEFDQLKSEGRLVNPGQRLWGIVQGASFQDLRKRSAKDISSLDFSGYAIGGVAVGESREEMIKAVAATTPYLPKEAPRHLLGVGTPKDIIQTVALGCDTFDCVIPTREARHGRLYVNGEEPLDIRLEKFSQDLSSPDSNCDCYTCQHFSKAYLRHLFMIEEPLAIRLFTLHNLKFYLTLMAKIRQSIQEGNFTKFAKQYGA